MLITDKFQLITVAMCLTDSRKLVLAAAVSVWRCAWVMADCFSLALIFCASCPSRMSLARAEFCRFCGTAVRIYDFSMVAA